MVNYTTAGGTQVELICWSNAGCYDTIQAPGPTIFTPPSTIDSCWVNVNNSVDPPWGGNYQRDIAKIYPAKTGGVYACGKFNEVAFASQYGDSLRISTPYGSGYLAKYDQNGVLKWWVHTEDITSYTNGDNIFDVVEDSKGNVYIYGSTSGLFIDNTGDTIQIQISNSNSRQYIIKLDSTGKYLRTYHMGVEVYDFVIDNADNLLISGYGSSKNVGFSVYLRNTLVNKDTLLQNWPDVLNHPIGHTSGRVYCKVDENGNVLWASRVMIGHSTPYEKTKITTDSLNNVYIAGSFGGAAAFYHPNSTAMDTITKVNGANQSFYLIKCDQNGNVLWTTSSESDRPCYIYDLKTDAAGNSYLTGANGVINSNETQYFYNADGTTETLNKGTYYIAKVNTNGVCQWMQGVSIYNASRGLGISLYKDEVSVMGDFSGNASVQVDFTGTYYTNVLNLLVEGSDFFIAVYDSIGVLKRVLKNGNNDHDLVISDLPDLFQNADGTYFLARNIAFYSNGSNHSQFGVNIPDVNGRDGTLSKFNNNCAVNYPACQPIYQLDSVFLCPTGTYTLPSGQLVLNEGHYISAFGSSGGCDSLVIETVVTKLRHTLDATDVTCYHETDGVIEVSPINGTPPFEYSIDQEVTYTSGNIFDSLSAGQYRVYIRDDSNCVYSSPVTVGVRTNVDTSLTINGSILGSNALGGVNYYWYDCDLGSTIPGENGNTFQVSNSGNYALILHNPTLGCWDTTACQHIILADITSTDSEANSAIRLSPNPTKSQIQIDFTTLNEEVNLRLYALDGRLLEQMLVNDKNQLTISLAQYPKGLYLLEIQQGGKKPQVFKVSKY